LLTIRVAAFAISLLLAIGAVAPEAGWFIVLSVLTGLGLLAFWGSTIRVGAFIVALLLAAGAVAPESGWLIALAVLTGVSVFIAPRALPLLPFGFSRRWADYW
jgi:hypothetical protein